MCVCNLDYSLWLKYATSYISVFGMSVTTKFTYYLITLSLSENVTEHNLCVMCCSTNSSIKVHILKIIELYIIMNVHSGQIFNK